MAEGTWYYAQGGQQQGPVPAEEVKSKLASGELSAHDLVWRDGMGNWQPAGNVEEFAGVARAPDPAPPGGYPPLAGGYGTPPGYGAPPPYGAPGYGAPGYGAPAYGAPGYGATGHGAPGYGHFPVAQYEAAGPPPPNHLVGAILATIFCCQPFGIVSIVYAAQVDDKWRAGDFAGANDASSKAQTWLTWAVGTWLVVMALVVLVNMASCVTTLR